MAATAVAKKAPSLKLGKRIGVISTKTLDVLRLFDPVRYKSERSLVCPTGMRNLQNHSKQKRIVLQNVVLALSPDAENAKVIGSPLPFVGYAEGDVVLDGAPEEDHFQWESIHRAIGAEGQPPKFVLSSTGETLQKVQMLQIRRKPDGCGGFLPWKAGCIAEAIL